MVNRAKAVRTVIAVLSLASLLLALWLVLRPAETGPKYDGKTLRAWSNTPKLTREQWRAVVRAAGTNAIPLLLEMLEAKDSAFRRNVITLLKGKRFLPVRLIPAEGRYRQAIDGLKALGEDAESAVPALIQLFERSSSEWSRNQAASALGSLGPVAKEAVPYLIRGAIGTNALLRLNSLGALYEIHSQPELVVPIFTNCLADPNPIARQYAIKGLGLFRKDARETVPAPKLQRWRDLDSAGGGRSESPGSQYNHFPLAMLSAPLVV